MKHIVSQSQCTWLFLKPTRRSQEGKGMSTAIIFARAGT